VKLVDFGLSAKLQADSRSRNSSVGTPWYTAPEVCYLLCSVFCVGVCSGLFAECFFLSLFLLVVRCVSLPQRQALMGEPLLSPLPQVIEGEEYDQSCDIWSVGCTLVEMTSGRSPYRDLNAMAALMQMSEDEHPPLPECSPACEAFLRHCWSKPHRSRPSARDLQADPFVRDLLIEGHEFCVLHKALPTPRVSSVFDLTGLADF
jgi:serine/threonine protein kinase